MPYVVLVDLERKGGSGRAAGYSCVPELLDDWALVRPFHANFLFRVAVRAVESWLMADRQRFAEFLGVPLNRVPPDPDTCNDPKGVVVTLARRSRRKAIQDAIVPKPGASARVGTYYTAEMSRYVEQCWRVDKACLVSPSLRRTVARLRAFSSNRST
jgi:hypothetical protein